MTSYRPTIQCSLEVLYFLHFRLCHYTKLLTVFYTIFAKFENVKLVAYEIVGVNISNPTANKNFLFGNRSASSSAWLSIEWIFVKVFRFWPVEGEFYIVWGDKYKNVNENVSQIEVWFLNYLYINTQQEEICFLVKNIKTHKHQVIFSKNATGFWSSDLHVLSKYRCHRYDAWDKSLLLNEFKFHQVESGGTKFSGRCICDWIHTFIQSIIQRISLIMCSSMCVNSFYRKTYLHGFEISI